MVKTIKLNKNLQRDMMIALFFSVFTIIFLFNLFWSPIILLIVGSYAIMNDKKLTANEMLAVSLAVMLVIYCCIARVFGIGSGMFIISIPLTIIALVYIFIWRK